MFQPGHTPHWQQRRNRQLRKRRHKVELVVNAPNATITNYGKFKTITIQAIAGDTWVEKGDGNSIIAAGNTPLHIVVDTLKSLASLIFKGTSVTANRVEVKSGTVGAIQVQSSVPVNITAEGTAKVNAVTVEAAADVSVQAKGTSEVAKVSVEAAGADVDVTASEASMVGSVEVTEKAASADGTEAAKQTKVDIKAEGTAEIGTVSTAAANAPVSVVSDGESKVSTVKVTGNAEATVSGDSKNVTTLDVTGAAEQAKVAVKTDTVKVETAEGVKTDDIVQNTSGKELDMTTKNADGTTTETTLNTDAGSSGDSGSSSSSSISSYPSSGSTQVSVTRVEITGTPKVGDTISATVTYSDNTTTEKDGTTYAWYVAESDIAVDAAEGWLPVAGQNAKTFRELTNDDIGKYFKIEVTYGSKTERAKTTSAVKMAYTLSKGGDTTTHTKFAVTVDGKPAVGEGMTFVEGTKVVVVPADGYTFTNVRYAANDETKDATKGNDGTYSFELSAHNTVVTATLSAKEIYVNYHGNNGGNDDVYKASVAYDTASCAVLSPDADEIKSVVTYAEHTFVGYNTLNDGSGTAYSVGDNIIDVLKAEIVAGKTDFELYAQWVPKNAKVSSIAWKNTTGANGSVSESEGAYTIEGNVAVTYENDDIPASTIAASALSWSFTSSTQSKTVANYSVNGTAVTWNADDNRFLSADDTVVLTGKYGSGGSNPAIEFTLTVTDEDAVYALTAATTEHGSFTLTTVDGKKAPDKILAGEMVVVTPSADDGYEIDSVTWKATDDDSATSEKVTAGNDVYKVQMPEKAITVSVAFKLKTYSYMTWDNDKKELVSAKTDQVVTSVTNQVDWSAGWYIVDSIVTISDRITVTGEVNLILADGTELTASKGINVTENNKLSIYAQSTGEGQGVLTANASDESHDGPTLSYAGIGGGKDGNGGIVTINGGTVTANGNTYGAGIGGGDGGAGGTVTINGGVVMANSRNAGAGIGGGAEGNGGTVTINGGTVTAISSAGAGIGGGYFGGDGGIVTINDGTVTAISNTYGAGIGGGGGSGDKRGDGGTVTINGGEVTATGGNGAVGIGKGDNGSSNGTLKIGGGVSVYNSSDSIDPARPGVVAATGAKNDIYTDTDAVTPARCMYAIVSDGGSGSGS